MTIWNETSLFTNRLFLKYKIHQFLNTRRPGYTLSCVKPWQVVQDQFALGILFLELCNSMYQTLSLNKQMDTQIFKQKNVLLFTGNWDSNDAALIFTFPPVAEFLTMSLYHSGQESFLIFRKNDLPPYPTFHTMWHLHLLPTWCQRAPSCSPKTRFKAWAYSEAAAFV